MINIAVLGFGIVGSGVVSVLDKNSEKITQNANQPISVKYILDIREFPESPYTHLFAKDFEAIVSDPDISIVVEAIGGINPALEFTRRALEAGKSVVTSNKELVAEHGAELLALAKKKNANYLFEASVGGGIPVVRPLAQCMTANIITEIYGVLNGTTNYILTDMEKTGVDFSVSLLEAQNKGYAEADPSSDIDGHDTCRKICILSSLAFGEHIFPSQVKTEGITGVTIKDLHYAAELGYKIKLLGRSRMVDDKVASYVAPHLVSNDCILSVVDGVTNGVVVRGNAVGDVVFCGAGAGKLPTASSVIADVIDASKHFHAQKWISWASGRNDFVTNPTLLDSAWYIRTDASREKVEKEFGNVIFSQGSAPEVAFITGVMNGEMIDDILKRGISAKSQFRVLGDH